MFTYFLHTLSYLLIVLIQITPSIMIRIQFYKADHGETSSNYRGVSRLPHHVPVANFKFFSHSIINTQLNTYNGINTNAQLKYTLQRFLNVGK